VPDPFDRTIPEDVSDYTQADIDALDAEIAVVRVAERTQSGNEMTQYRPLKDLLALRASMTSAVATAAGRPRSRVAAFDKGV
jgi:hypothetical protein